MRQTLRLAVSHWSDDGGAPGGSPLVDDVPLESLVAEYEEARGFEPAGGYGDLVVGNFDFGDLRAYFLGASSDPYWGDVGKIAVLACGGCGGVGCWPLHVLVTADEDIVTWSGFEQPHRSGWDYSKFGHFAFARVQYDAAIEEAAAQIT